MTLFVDKKRLVQFRFVCIQLSYLGAKIHSYVSLLMKY